MFEMETYKIFGDREHSLIEMTLGDLLDKVAEVYPDNDCVVCNDKPFRKTYKEFKEECDTTAKGLMALGVEKGSHVAIWATNYPECAVLMFASLQNRRYACNGQYEL